MLGHHVYDHTSQELGVTDLERSIDPFGNMNPMLRRGYLWKTVPTFLWRVADPVKGYVPSQPQMDSHFCSKICTNNSAPFLV
jgi:hypothetical protein